MPWTFPNSHAILTCSRPAMWSHDARVGELRDPNLLKLETGLFEANDETGHGQTPQAMKRQDLDARTMEAGDKRPSWVAILPSRVQGSPSLGADINCTAVASYLPTLPRLAARHHLADHGEATPSLSTASANVPLHARSGRDSWALRCLKLCLGSGYRGTDDARRRRREASVLGGVTTIAEPQRPRGAMGKRGPDCAIAFASLPGAAGPGQGRGRGADRRTPRREPVQRPPRANGQHQRPPAGQPPTGDAGPEQDEPRPDPQVAGANLGASWRQNGAPPPLRDAIDTPSTPAHGQPSVRFRQVPNTGTASSAMSSASRNGPPLSRTRPGHALSSLSLSGLWTRLCL